MESINGVKVKKVVNYIIMIAICLIVILLSILVGTPLEENTEIITIMTTGIFMIAVIYYQVIKRKNEEKIKINGLDIVVSILCISPFIPLIFQTAISIEDSIHIAIRYITILMIYASARIVIHFDKKCIDYIVGTIIATGFISAVIGIDNMTYKFFLDPLYKIGVPFVVNIENRMFGNFGYANAFAISLVVPFFLSLDRYVKSKKEIGKHIYTGLNFLFLSCILLSYSKAVYMVICFVIGICIFLHKDKETRIKMICNILATGICSIIYTKIFMSLYQEENNLAIWLITIEFIFIAIITNMIIVKLIEKKQIDVKTFKRILVVLCVLIILFILVGLKLKTPLVMFEKETQTSEVKYKISNIKPNTDYQFVFDVEARSLYDHRIYSIQVIEEDEHYQTIKEHEIKLKTFLGQKTIEFKTDPKTVEFALIFKSSNPKEQKGLKINKLEINGEEYVLNYAYLPASVVNKIKTFQIHNLSVSERLTFYKDAMKLIKENPLTGIGGNGWNYKYWEVASYDYESTQVHSYPIQILLEFGIVAIIAYIALIVYVIRYLIKKENIGVIIALIAILLHSIVDFDLSFMNLLCYTFLLIAIVSTDVKDHENE